MVDVNVNFVLGRDEPLRANFELQPDVTYTADIRLSDATRDHTKLYNRDRANQHPMGAITGLEDALSELNTADEQLEQAIADEATSRQNADITLQENITAENNRAVEAEEALDNKIDLEVDTRADEITRVEGLISDEETRAKGVEQDLRDDLTAETNRATNAEDVLQDNITAEENRAKGVEQQLSSSIDSDHTAISNHVSDKNNPHEVTKAQVGLGNVENLAPANMPMSTATKTYVDNADTVLQGQITTINTTIGGYGNIVTHNVNEFATASQGALADTALQPNDNISELTNNLNYQTVTQVANSIAVETNNRESADNNLQSQIDAIVSASDVFDIVGTYAELQAYDISTVPVNDIIKVLVDSTHAGAATYYRCVENNNVKSWSYIGSEGAYYTKAEADNNFVPQTRTVNGKALSSNIALTAGDVGALPSSTVIPTVNNSTVTIQKNGSTVSTFTLNQSSNETVNLTVPTKTSDLTNDSGFITSSSLPTVNNGQLDIQVNGSSVATFTANQSGNTTADITIPTATSDLTNDSGFITVSALSGYATESWVTNKGYITGISSSDVTTALGYTPYNSTNPNGYTNNVGTVTSVNNVQPDANGNVTIQAGGIQNTATGTDSLTILGNPASDDFFINIGTDSGKNSTAEEEEILCPASIAIGVQDNSLEGAKVGGQCAIAIGTGTNAEESGVAIGYASQAGTSGVAVGGGTSASSNGVAVGGGAKAQSNYSIVLGDSTYASVSRYATNAVAINGKVSGISNARNSNNAIAIGGTVSAATNAIQLGSGTNSTANSLQVGSYQLLDTSTGLIPDARISTNIARVNAIPTITYDPTTKTLTWS